MNEESTTGISVILPCHNGGRFVTEAVESVAAQPMSCAREIIVIDDGSDDPDTVAAIDASGEIPGVRVVRLPDNRGAQAARNAGLDAARYDYVLPLDCDDQLAIDPVLLADGTYPDQAVQILSSTSDVAFVHTFSRMFGEFDGLTISAYPCHEQLLVRKHHAPMAIVYRRTDALAAGGYDHRIRKWQDWAFAIDLLAARHRHGTRNQIRCVPGPFHEYRIHSQFTRLSAAAISELEMTRLVVDKNLDYFRTILGEDRSAAELAALVCTRKPDRLIELLHMAAVDLDQALTVARQRSATLASPIDALGIP
ncbi:glycosyltransferase family 2 protein [Nocardia brasiliensis]|uniref:glycosyltransferase family 2 protein n=1 Tax=Nocardia brasiliensis TaxID=37326 RepID=UPI003672052A